MWELMKAREYDIYAHIFMDIYKDVNKYVDKYVDISKWFFIF